MQDKLHNIKIFFNIKVNEIIVFINNHIINFKYLPLPSVNLYMIFVII